MVPTGQNRIGYFLNYQYLVPNGTKNKLRFQIWISNFTTHLPFLNLIDLEILEY